MKLMDAMKADYERKLAEQEDNLKFYRPYFDRAYKAEKALEEKSNKLERIQRILNSEGVKEIVA